MLADREEHELQISQGPFALPQQVVRVLVERQSDRLGNTPGAVSTIVQITTGIVRVSMTLAHNLIIGDYAFIVGQIRWTRRTMAGIRSFPCLPPLISPTFRRQQSHRPRGPR